MIQSFTIYGFDSNLTSPIRHCNRICCPSAMIAMAASVAATASTILCYPSSRMEAPLSSLRCFCPNKLVQLGTQARLRLCSNGLQGAYSPDYNASPIDVVAEVKSQKILVLGGNGFVGTMIYKRAIAQGISVVSLSQSGRPSNLESWVDQITWISGDVFVTEWDSLLDGVQAVVSTLGMLGPNDQMEKINADANIIAVNAAKKADLFRGGPRREMKGIVLSVRHSRVYLVSSAVTVLL